MSNEPWLSGGSMEVGCLDDGCLFGCMLVALAVLVILS